MMQSSICELAWCGQLPGFESGRKIRRQPLTSEVWKGSGALSDTCQQLLAARFSDSTAVVVWICKCTVGDFTENVLVANTAKLFRL